MERRNRLEQAEFPDEPHEGFEAYQAILNRAYELKNQGEFGDARSLLEQNQRLRQSPYQRARTEFIFAEERKEQDRLGIRVSQLSQQSTLSAAAEHYSRASEAAKQVFHWALFAQLKSMESYVLYGDVPHQFSRAFQAARVALKAWRLLPDHDRTDDLKTEFRLAEDLGVKAQFVAEDIDAVDALEKAALALHRLQGRHDVDAQTFANGDLHLFWDWALLYQTLGHYRLAFAHALKTRRKGKDLVNPIDPGRLQYLIASIANDCVELGGVGDYSRNRLLNAAEAAIHEAYALTQKHEDRAGYALTLLADAKWMGLKRIADGRIARIEQAEKIASERGDDMIHGFVEIAWGDEYAFQNLARRAAWKVEKAREWYYKAEERFAALEALNYARQARRRRERLP